jgi:hypothetical protein
MTVSQLYNSVAQLGFEDSLEADENFIFAANRALLQVNALRPATSTCVINHKPMENKVNNAMFDPVDKTTELIYYADDVKSYYFEADGTGVLYIEKLGAENGEWDIIGMVEFSGSREFTAYRGFIKKDGAFITGTVRMRFVGEFIYSVRNVAMYEYLYSANPNDVPAYEPFCKYDISSLVNDFLSLASPPVIEEGAVVLMNQGYGVENGRVILLPYNKRGIYRVIYNRRPQSITYEGELADDETKIDLDEDLCALLPILVASYVWVDDDPEKAQYYLMLYNERAVDIERRIYNATPITITSINGW